ncbi:hypothetical protein BX600DRAFT_432993 [Xylariales sp. PMI_506]|nr:hypothetical protein BX600DRAFT_432993 [Xylariales sp. PMI_506]
MVLLRRSNIATAVSLIVLLACNTFTVPIAAAPLTTPAIPIIDFDKFAGSDLRFSEVSKRTVDISTCDSSESAAIRFAWGEIQNVVSAAQSRTNDLYDYLQNIPTARPTDPILLSTFQTFEALFGQVFYGLSSTANNLAGLNRVSQIASLISALQSGLNDASLSYLRIYCDDSWLSTTDADGDVAVTTATSIKLYAEPLEKWLELSNLGGGCRSNAALSGFAFPSATFPSTGVVGDIITLCQSMWDGWTSAYQEGDSMSKLASATGLAGSTNLGSVQSMLPITLLHELTHAQSFLGGSGIMVDVSCDNGETAYNFICVNMLASSNPAQAVKNADSFALYAAAMYMSNYDWSTGIAAELL